MEDNDRFEVEWDETVPEPRVRPIKPGNYVCSAEKVEFAKAKTGTEGVQIAFIVLEGEYRGLTLPAHHVWVRNFPATTSAENQTKMKRMARRDLEMLGFSSFRIEEPVTVSKDQHFIVTVVRDEEAPLGRVYAFNPA